MIIVSKICIKDKHYFSISANNLLFIKMYMETFSILLYNVEKRTRGSLMNMDILQAISQVGFPIAVASYSLVVLNKTVHKNTEVMTKIAAKLDIETETK